MLMICHNGLVSPVRTCPEQSEVTEIVKQRFLPELGKLLTAEDEQQLMDLLVSPTRQAVVLARTYNKKEREHLLASPEEEDQTPAFVLAIDKIYQQVAPRREGEPEAVREPEAEPVQVNQFSLFPDEPHPIADSEYVPFKIEAEAVPIEGSVEALPVEPVSPDEARRPGEEPPLEEPPEPVAEDEAPAEEIPAEERPAEQEPAPAEPAAPAEPKTEEQLFPKLEEPAAEETTVPASVQEPEPELPTVKLNAADYDLDNLDYIPETRRKTRVFLLILYILLAIPVALAGIVLLLIPALAALALAVGVIVLGSAALVAAFSLFQQLADLLILLGTAIIVLALGLLLLWLFVWFIGGAIAGLIRGIIDLGRKWCFVEVPV